MARPSSIDRLPKEIREEIGGLRQAGCTIDEILAKLREWKVSRSALGRHLKGFEAVADRMRQSRVMAEALTAKFGDQPDNQVARLNFELMHGIVFQTLITADGSEEAQDGDDEEGQSLTLGPAQVRQLAASLKDLASAQKTDADRTLKIQEAALKQAVKRVDEVARAEGWSADTAAQVRAKIMGVTITKVAGQVQTP